MHMVRSTLGRATKTTTATATAAITAATATTVPLTHSRDQSVNTVSIVATSIQMPSSPTSSVNKKIKKTIVKPNRGNKNSKVVTASSAVTATATATAELNNCHSIKLGIQQRRLLATDTTKQNHCLQEKMSN